MPKTKFEGLVFSLIMVFVMVYFMTFYNVAYTNGVNLGSAARALFTMWPEAVIAFFVQKFVGGPMSQKIFLKVKNKIAEINKPFFLASLRGFCTVIIMAPCMTLCVSIMHNGLGYNIPSVWMACLAHNFLFALLLQVFFAGPFVRLSFRTIFTR